ncbi:Ada metal-binding domain-containing protein [Larkinella sp. VNQ87]|uniref:Ada metal-binding domain-containing protein n=1 Tax=Larkinella sp. VNQ87 TaxID=3400921 RepID=UPI003BFB3008
MICHTDFADTETGLAELWKLIKTGQIVFGGNAVLKTYGTLRCQSGRRMHRKNRVFFSSEDEAVASGFRPCGHCLRAKYRLWKEGGAGYPRGVAAKTASASMSDNVTTN